MKKIALAAVFIFNVFFITFSAGANEPQDYINVYTDYYDSNSFFYEVVWNGKTAMKENTIYYVDNKITISKIRQLPASSMLVVREGGHITVNSTGALYIVGHFGIEDGGIVEVNKSKLVLNSGSITGINGSLYINNDSELKVYSKIYLYRNGLLSLSGLMQTYKNGKLLFANDIRMFNNGNFRGNRARIEGMPIERFSTAIELKSNGFMRFYDRRNKVTYKITNQVIIDKICSTLNKIKLIPIRESTILTGSFENRYAIRLYDEAGAEYFYFERPEYENDGSIYIDGIIYMYPESSMDFDEFYYYALGIKNFYKR